MHYCNIEKTASRSDHVKDFLFGTDLENKKAGNKVS